MIRGRALPNRLTRWVFAPILLAASMPLAAQTPLNEANHAIQRPDIPAKVDAVPSKKVEIVNNADAPPAPPQVSDTGVFIGAITVEGAPDVPAEAFATALEPFMGKKLTTPDLSNLCHAIANVARARGYSFASAYIPPQQLALAMLRVTLDEGVVKSVRIVGSSNRQLAATMNRLSGHAPTTREIEQQVFLASDIPGVTLKRIRFVRENGAGVLVVEARQTRLKGVVSLDNGGTSELGPERVSLSVGATSVLRDGDALTVSAVATPIKPKELGFVALKYDLPLDADGTVVSGSAGYGHTKPGADLAEFDVTGDSYNLSLSISHPFARGRNTSFWISAGLDYLASRQSVYGVRINDDKLAIAWLSMMGKTKLLRGRLRSELTLTQGLPIFGATLLGDPMASRWNASEAFTKAVLGAEWTGQIDETLGLRLATRAQIASGPLLSAEQLTLGGSQFGRAFSASTLSGDEGVVGLIELRSDINHPVKWLDWVQPYVFADGGRVMYLGGDQGGGTLLSAGGGVRARVGKTYFNLESAIPLTANPIENDDHKPRINFQVAKSF